MPYKDPEAKRAWAAKHPRPEKNRYPTTEDGRVQRRQIAARYRERHPDRELARRMVHEAVERGELVKQSCRECLEPKTDAHHWLGYAPEHHLDVIWLCPPCHREVHRG